MAEEAVVFPDEFEEKATTFPDEYEGDVAFPDDYSEPVYDETAPHRPTLTVPKDQEAAMQQLQMPRFREEDIPSVEELPENARNILSAQNKEEEEERKLHIKQSEQMARETTIAPFGIDALRFNAPPEYNAAAIEMGAGALDVWHGLQQIYARGAGDKELLDDLEFQRYWANVLMESEELGTHATVGRYVGYGMDLSGYLIPASRGKTLAQAVKYGAGTGAVMGGLSFEDEGETRLGKTIAGSVFGGTLNGLAYSILRASGNKKMFPEIVEAPRMFKSVEEAKKFMDNYRKDFLVEVVETGDVFKAYQNMDKYLPGNNLALRNAQVLTGEKMHLPTPSMAKKIVEEENLGYVPPDGWIKNGIQNLMQPISDRIEMIAPKVWNRLRQYELDILLDIRKGYEEVSGFFHNMGKMKDSHQQYLKAALLNGDFNEAKVIIKDHAPYRMKQEFGKMLKYLQNTGSKAVDLGLLTKDELIENYFPRVITDLKGMQKAVRKNLGLDLKKMLADQQAKFKDKHGREMNQQEINDFMNKTIFGELVKNIPEKPGVAGSLKKRRINIIPDWMLPYYANPELAMDIYINTIHRDLNKVKFFGAAWTKKKGNVTDWIEDSIGELLVKEDLSPANNMELKDLLKLRLITGEQTPARSIQVLRNMTYGTLLGNPYAAATQLGELGLATWVNGLENTVDGLIQKMGFKGISIKKDFGLSADKLQQEFNTVLKTGFDRAYVQKLLKVGLFDSTDRLGKAAIVNGAWVKLRRDVGEGNLKYLSRKYRKAFGGEWADVVEDIRNGNFSPNVKLLLFHELSEVQPLNLSEMPAAYLKHPNMRIFYALKTFTIKQLNLLKKKSYNMVRDGMKEKDGQMVQEGILNLGRYAMIMGMANMGAQEIKDSIVRKEDVEPQSVTDKWFWGLMKVLSVSKYTAENIASGQWENFLTDTLGPVPLLYPASVLGDVATGDTEDAIKQVPYARILHAWLGGGAEEFQEKKWKEQYGDISKFKKEFSEELDEQRKDIKNQLGFAEGGSVDEDMWRTTTRPMEHQPEDSFSQAGIGKPEFEGKQTTSGVWETETGLPQGEQRKPFTFEEERKAENIKKARERLALGVDMLTPAGSIATLATGKNLEGEDASTFENVASVVDVGLSTLPFYAAIIKGFASPLGDVIKNAPKQFQKGASPKEWKQLLASKAKGEELDMSKLQEWLSSFESTLERLGRKEKLSADNVANVLEGKKIPYDIVRLKKSGENLPENDPRFIESRQEYLQGYDNLRTFLAENNLPTDAQTLLNITDIENTDDIATELVGNNNALREALANQIRTIRSQRERYEYIRTEVFDNVIDLPTDDVTRTMQPQWESFTHQDIQPDTYEELIITSPVAGQYEHPTHFPGIKGNMGHIRWAKADLQDGTSPLMVQELQSDIIQQGRRHGFLGPAGEKSTAADELAEVPYDEIPEGEFKKVAEELGYKIDKDREGNFVLKSTSTGSIRASNLNEETLGMELSSLLNKSPRRVPFASDSEKSGKLFLTKVALKEAAQRGEDSLAFPAHIDTVGNIENWRYEEGWASDRARFLKPWFEKELPKFLKKIGSVNKKKLENGDEVWVVDIGNERAQQIIRDMPDYGRNVNVELKNSGVGARGVDDGLDLAVPEVTKRYESLQKIKPAIRIKDTGEIVEGTIGDNHHEIARGLKDENIRFDFGKWDTGFTINGRWKSRKQSRNWLEDELGLSIRDPYMTEEDGIDAMHLERIRHYLTDRKGFSSNSQGMAVRDMISGETFGQMAAPKFNPRFKEGGIVEKTKSQKLEPGVYQDDAGSYFQVTANGELLDL